MTCTENTANRILKSLKYVKDFQLEPNPTFADKETKESKRTFKGKKKSSKASKVALKVKTFGDFQTQENCPFSKHVQNPFCAEFVGLFLVLDEAVNGGLP